MRGGARISLPRSNEITASSWPTEFENRTKSCKLLERTYHVQRAKKLLTEANKHHQATKSRLQKLRHESRDSPNHRQANEAGQSFLSVAEPILRHHRGLVRGSVAPSWEEQPHRARVPLCFGPPADLPNISERSWLSTRSPLESWLAFFQSNFYS